MDEVIKVEAGPEFMPARIMAARCLLNRRFEQRKSGEPVLRVEDLADKLSVAGQTVWRWENGHCSPPAEKLGFLAAALGVEVGFFYG